jgi:hypothetical protein
VDQEKDGATNTHEDRTQMDGLCRVAADDDNDDDDE